MGSSDGRGCSRADRRAEQEAQRALKAAAQLSTSACNLLLVRHGETPWNVEGRLQGQSPSAPGLNEEGFEQAKVLAQALLAHDMDAVYSSDLTRCIQTAQAVVAARPGQPLEVRTSARLRERALGLLEGCTMHEAEEAHPEAMAALRARSPSAEIPGGGESIQQLQERVGAEVERIARLHPGQRVLVVAHGGVLSALHACATEGRAGSRYLNGGISHLRVEPGKPWALLAYNQTAHLAAARQSGAMGGGARGAFGGGVEGG